MTKAPPNLRYSDNQRDCANCQAFKAQAQVCAMFSDYPVAPELVCDSWEAKDSEAVRNDGQATEH